MTRTSTFLLISALFAIATNLPPHQPTTLQKKLNDLHVHNSWIYNDLAAGVAEAKKTGKPLLVVFR